MKIKILYLIILHVLYLYCCQVQTPAPIQTVSLFCEKDTITSECIVNSKLDSAYHSPQLIDSILFFNELKLFLKQNKLTSQSEYFVYATFELNEVGQSSQYFLTSEVDPELPISSSRFQELIYKTKWFGAKYHNKGIKSSVGISFNLKKRGICSFQFQSHTYSRLIFRIEAIPFD